MASTIRAMANRPGYQRMLGVYSRRISSNLAKIYTRSSHDSFKGRRQHSGLPQYHTTSLFTICSPCIGQGRRSRKGHPPSICRCDNPQVEQQSTDFGSKVARTISHSPIHIDSIFSKCQSTIITNFSKWYLEIKSQGIYCQHFGR